MSFLFKKVSAQDNDAAAYRVVHAKGVGKWWVEPNVGMFGGEWGKGRKEFATREEAEKYAKGMGKTYIVRDECEGEDAAEFKVGDKVLRKGYPAPSPRDYYKVIEVHPNGGVQLDDGFNGYYSPNLIIRAKDSAAMDALSQFPRFSGGSGEMLIHHLRDVRAWCEEQRNHMNDFINKNKDNEEAKTLSKIYEGNLKNFDKCISALRSL